MNQQHNYKHQFAALIHLKETVDQFSPENTLSFAEFLVDNGKHKIILSGIFHQLYQEGKQNDDAFYARVLNKAKELISSNPKSTSKPTNSTDATLIHKLPDGILCVIASCLSSADILTKWIHVNRAFAKIGYKPETHQQWNMNIYCHENSIEKYPPKFSLDSIVSLAKHTNYKIYQRKKHRLIDPSKMKALKSISLDGVYIFLA